LFVLSVTAVPFAGFTEPVEEIRMSPEALVDCGVVTAVEMIVSALAGTAAVAATIAPRAVVPSKERMRESPFLMRREARRIPEVRPQTVNPHSRPSVSDV
jgi:hypothetical protein